MIQGGGCELGKGKERMADEKWEGRECGRESEGERCDGKGERECSRSFVMGRFLMNSEMH